MLNDCGNMTEFGKLKYENIAYYTGTDDESLKWCH